jgi:hypothetical protein
MMRKCILGAMIYFQFHPDTRDSVRYIEVFKANFVKFEDEYRDSRAFKLSLLEQQIHFLSSRFSNSEIDDTFLLQLQEFYGFDPRTVEEFASFLFNCSILAENNKVQPYPGNSTFKAD